MSIILLIPNVLSFVLLNSKITNILQTGSDITNFEINSEDIPKCVTQYLSSYKNCDITKILTLLFLVQVCMISMVCCEGARRKAPTNYIFLTVFTGKREVIIT